MMSFPLDRLVLPASKEVKANRVSRGHLVNQVRLALPACPVLLALLA
jgi:hypothetical protein